MKRRHLILLLGGTGSGVLSVGTGAFSSAQAERDVEMNVVDDDEALVGYHAPKARPANDDPVTNGDRITLVEVRNRFRENQQISLVGVQIEAGHAVLTDYEVERKLPDSPDGEYETVGHVAIEEGTAEPDPVDAPNNGFAPGGYERITADVCGIGSDESVEIEVTVTLEGVSGTGVAAKLFGDTRAFTITGGDWTDVTGSVDRVQFLGGSGNANIRTGSDDGAKSAKSAKSGSSGVVTASAYYETDDSSVKKTGCEQVAVDAPLKPKDFGSGGFDSIVGVTIAGIEGVFVHPEFDSSECAIPNGSPKSGGKVSISSDLPSESDAFDDCLDDSSS